MFFPNHSRPRPPYQQQNYYRPHPYQMNNAPPGYPPPAHYQAHPRDPWGNYYAQVGNYPGYPPQPQQVSKTTKLINTFQTAEGKFDYQKAWTTMDHVVKTANQVSPIVKQVGNFFTRP